MENHHQSQSTDCNEHYEDVEVAQPSKQSLLKFDPKETSILDILLVFTELQSQRVHWHKSLEDHFIGYLEGKINAEAYKAHNLNLLDDQKRFTHQTLTLIDNLNDESTFDRKDLGTKIKLILEKEKDLLQAVAQYQTATVLTRTTDNDYEDNINSAKSRVKELRIDISDSMLDLHSEMAEL